MSLVDNIVSVIDAIGAKLKTAQGDIDEHVADTENPHEVTAAQVGAPTITGATAIAVVAALPETPDANTIYLVTG